MKFKELKKLTSIEREKKVKELKLELIKSKTGGKARQIKKILARINTLNSLKKIGEKK
ncbi:MAG: 50S ribosomal protein L29 [Nanoarchaeota archaeon]|nr:50S ribosomal protein L29 [Nanoarchaeota archaeon]